LTDEAPEPHGRRWIRLGRSIARVSVSPGSFFPGTFGRDDVSLPHSDGDSRTTTMSSSPFQRPGEEAPRTDGHAAHRLSWPRAFSGFMVVRRLLRSHADGGVRRLSAGGHRACRANRQVVDQQVFGGICRPARRLITPRTWTGRAPPSIDCKISALGSAPEGNARTTPDPRASGSGNTPAIPPHAARSFRAFAA